jgi:hypothetical protein
MIVDLIYHEYHHSEPFQKMADIWPNLIFQGDVKAKLIANFHETDMNTLSKMIFKDFLCQILFTDFLIHLKIHEYEFLPLLDSKDKPDTTFIYFYIHSIT